MPGESVTPLQCLHVLDRTFCRPVPAIGYGHMRKLTIVHLQDGRHRGSDVTRHYRVAARVSGFPERDAGSCESLVGQLETPTTRLGIIVEVLALHPDLISAERDVRAVTIQSYKPETNIHSFVEEYQKLLDKYVVFLLASQHPNADEATAQSAKAMPQQM
ncbi:MAG: hypothetical protein Q9159_003343 [Coniocarpon cinnabarinum]